MEKSIDSFQQSVDLFKENGQFDQAASFLKKIGEYFEQKDKDLAANYFLEASELYALTKFHVTDTQKLRLKVAQIYSSYFNNPEKLKRAIEIYEDIAYDYLSNNLMRFHSKKIFFKCTLLFLLLDDDIGAGR